MSDTSPLPPAHPPDRPYRLFVIGAGFSVPAGLPLGERLLEEVLKAAKSLDGGGWYKNIIRQDIERFAQYQAGVGDSGGVTFEGLISFLDIEHHLRLSGSDTYTDQGNRTQMVVRNLVSWVLLDCMRKMTDTQWRLYEDFSRQLRPGDTVITFNYDLILEAALTKVGVPYRYAPNHFKSPGRIELVHPDRDVVVLKLHGSMDWFDKEPVRRERESVEQMMSLFHNVRNSVFTDPRNHGARSIVAGTNTTGRLCDVYQIDMQRYFDDDHHFVTQAPLIISPSLHKIAHLPALRDLWWGLGRDGGAHLQMTVIGFSMPGHDAYLRQLIWGLVRSYQQFDYGIPGWEKDPLRFVDFRPTPESFGALKAAYPFVDWTKAEVKMDGFDRDAIPFIFGRWQKRRGRSKRAPS